MPSSLRVTVVPRARAPRRALAPLAFVTLLLAAGCGGSNGGSTGPTPVQPQPCTFSNPVATGADPSVVRHEGAYYAVQSRNGSIWVSRSANLSDVFTASPVRVWTPAAGAPNTQNIWAPQLAVVDGRWYIYFAAGASSAGGFTNQRSYVLEATGTDPQGAWVERGQLETGGSLATREDDMWAIDLAPVRIGGQLYALWSGWEQNASTDKTQQNIYIAPMANPTTISGARVRISQPDQPWEDIPNSFDLQEGPELLVRDGRTFVVYSTQGSWTPDYRYGLLELTNPGAPTDPASWTKTGPVFQRTPAVAGPGHGTFALSPDGSEWWMIYHANPADRPGWENRVIRMQPFTWNANGLPNFGTPADPGRLIARPAGECRG
jgi:GH43 family beta-xylosidase